MDADPRDECGIVRSYVGVLIGFKFLGLAIILGAMASTGFLGDSSAFLTLYHLPWVLAAAALGYRPGRALYRRVRAQARRRRLIWSEWHVEDAPSAGRRTRP